MGHSAELRGYRRVIGALTEAVLEVRDTSHVGVQGEASGEVHDIVVPVISFDDELDGEVVRPHVNERIFFPVLKHMVAVFAIDRVGMATALVDSEQAEQFIEILLDVTGALLSPASKFWAVFSADIIAKYDLILLIIYVVEAG